MREMFPQDELDKRWNEVERRCLEERGVEVNRSGIISFFDKFQLEVEGQVRSGHGRAETDPIDIRASIRPTQRDGYFAAVAFGLPIAVGRDVETLRSLLSSMVEYAVKNVADDGEARPLRGDGE